MAMVSQLNNRTVLHHLTRNMKIKDTTPHHTINIHSQVALHNLATRDTKTALNPMHLPKLHLHISNLLIHTRHRVVPILHRSTRLNGIIRRRLIVLLNYSSQLCKIDHSTMRTLKEGHLDPGSSFSHTIFHSGRMVLKAIRATHKLLPLAPILLDRRRSLRPKTHMFQVRAKRLVVSTIQI